MGKRRKFRLSSALVTFLVVSLLAGVSVAGAALSKEDAKGVLTGLVPDVQVISVEKSVIKGLWEVVIKSRGQNHIVYIDDARKHVISGSIIDSATKTNITKVKFDEINKVDVSLIPIEDTFLMGDKDAKHKVFVFDDPD